MVDSMTNSSSEGFRLEGFDGLPSALQSCNPLEGSFFKHSEKSVRARRLPTPPSAPTACCECATCMHRRLTTHTLPPQEKKAKRFQFQRLPAKRILAYFLDVRDTPDADPSAPRAPPCAPSPPPRCPTACRFPETPRPAPAGRLTAESPPCPWRDSSPRLFKASAMPQRV